MPFHVRDPETDTLVRQLARQRGCGLTEAVKTAVRAELRRGEPSFAEKIKTIQDEFAKYPSTGLEADKAFYDSLWEEED